MPSSTRSPEGASNLGHSREAKAGGSRETIASSNEKPREGEVDELLMHMSLADNGQLSCTLYFGNAWLDNVINCHVRQNGHFGGASLFWDPPPDAVAQRLRHRAHKDSEASGLSGTGASPRDPSVTSQMDDIAANLVESNDGRSNAHEAGILKMNVAMIQGWETLAYNKLELERGLGGAQAITHLLETYFCWQHASHCVIYRAVFMRDMALDGQYFNEFLLQVVCAIRYSPSGSNASSTKHGNNAMEAEYMSWAKALLLTEMDQPSSVPTIHSLLLLGQRDCAHSDLSQV